MIAALSANRASELEHSRHSVVDGRSHIVCSPLLLPLAREIGTNDIHFCIVMVTALGVGFITPPFGLNLFVVAGITGTPVLAIAARVLPYVLGMLAVVLLLAYLPVLSLWAL